LEFEEATGRENGNWNSLYRYVYILLTASSRFSLYV
jgi:hypothetical protein